ncbi:MAG TPA: large conductance mechanosensitive channel protein MscL [Acidimicrobiales bacterium]|nr:large conductance mechanosensitive channel protein MscL [Acidimicrobiales bacterium]
MSSFVSEFKQFLARGNVLDLAVAVVIGAAFTAVVQSFANDILLQLVAAIFGEADFSSLALTWGTADPETGLQPGIYYGSFITALVNFAIIAFAVFLVVKAFNEMQRRKARGEAPADEEPPAPTETELLAEIRDLIARRPEGLA